MPVGSVEQPPLAPPGFWSALDSGCGDVETPLVPAVPVLWSAAAYAALMPAHEASTTVLAAVTTTRRLSDRNIAFDDMRTNPLPRGSVSPLAPRAAIGDRVP